MSQPTNPNPEFVNPGEPLEIFCCRKYLNYHIRGQITSFSDRIYGRDLPEEGTSAHYRRMILVLMKDTWSTTKPAIPRNYTEFGTIFGRTPKEFLDLQRTFELQRAEKTSDRTGRPIKDVLETALEFKNPPLIIDLKEAGISSTPYLNTAIQNGKNIILLKIEISLDKVFAPGKISTLPVHSRHIHQLLGYHFSSNGRHQDEETVKIFKQLYNILRFDLDYDLVTENEYCRLLTKIGELSNRWMTQTDFSSKPVLQKYRENLNLLLCQTRDRKDPFHNFCYQFILDLLADLRRHKFLDQCQRCKDVMKYRLTKKGCSEKYDGKNCSDRMRKNRGYETKKARESTEKLLS